MMFAHTFTHLFARMMRIAKNRLFAAVSNGPWRTRTSNLGIKSPLLYQLS
jgi:hypothetical protein